MASIIQEPLSDRLKDQVTASIRDSLEKATNVLSNLHRIQSYLDIIQSLPTSRAGDVVKNAVEQIKGVRNDAASLLQTIYLTEIGLQSMQDFDKQGITSVSSFMPILGDAINSSVITPSASINSNKGDEDSSLSLPNDDVISENDGEPSPKKSKLGVMITSCLSCNRKFAYQSSSGSSPLCRVCRENTSTTDVTVPTSLPPTDPSTSRVVTSLTPAKAISPKTTSTPKERPPRKRKTGLSPQKCRLCDASFVYRRCLFRHIKENHPGADKSNLGQYIDTGGSLTAGNTEVHMVVTEESVLEHETEVEAMSSSSLHVTIGSEVGGANASGNLTFDTPTSNQVGESQKEENNFNELDDPNASIIKTDDGQYAILTIHNEKVYKCLTCSKAFSRPYRIQRHLQVHNPSRHRVQCHLCEKFFTRVDTLQTHIRCVHTDERPFVCTFEGCEKRFPVQSGLVHHLKSHMDGKPYKCPECHTSFALMSEFKGHIATEHSSTKELRCSDCFKLFASTQELNDHRSLEHRLECEICNKTFARLGFLQAHVEIHSGPSLYNCRFCNSGFDNEYSYKQHVKAHPKYNRVRKTHPCPVCNDTFLDSKELMEHYQTEEHRQNVTSLGVNTSILHTLGQDLPSDVTALVEEASISGADEHLMESIAQSEAFKAALSAGVSGKGVEDSESD